MCQRTLSQFFVDSAAPPFCSSALEARTHSWEFFAPLKTPEIQWVLLTKNAMLKWITSIFFDENSQWFQVSKLKSHSIRSSKLLPKPPWRFIRCPYHSPAGVVKKPWNWRVFVGGHEPSGGGGSIGIMQWVYYTVFRYIKYIVFEFMCIGIEK